MVHGPPPSRARLRPAAAAIAARRSVLVFSPHRSLMSIHTEKPNPRLSTKPVTTPENTLLVVVARRVDGVRFSDRRGPRRRRSDGVVHYCNGCASLAPRWCRRDAIDATHLMALVGPGDSKLLTRTQRRRHERTEELSIVKVSLYFYSLRAAIAEAPTAWSVSRAFRSSSPWASIRSSVCWVCSLKASWI